MLKYPIAEGSFTLPAGFTDRTVNTFTLGRSAQSSFNFTLSRDQIRSNEDIHHYVERQINIIKKAIKNYQLDEKTDALLGQHINGLSIYGHWKEGGKSIYQRQAAFLIDHEKILIFGATSATVFNDNTNNLWQRWLASYQPVTTTQ